jgi:hypothetical protein
VQPELSSLLARVVMRLVVIYCVLFCPLVNSSRASEKARRTFRQLERVVRLHFISKLLLHSQLASTAYPLFP